MSGESSDILLGTVVPFSWYRGCAGIASAHFSEMASARCNAVRIDVSEEDLVFRVQEVAAVVQLAVTARLKPLVGLCGLAGLFGRGSLSRADAESSPFLRNNQHGRKVDGCGALSPDQACARNPKFVDYACALCCAVGCIRNVAGISFVHPNFSMCFCRLCVGERGELNNATPGALRYKRGMSVLPDEDDEQMGSLHSCASATLHLLQAMFLSFRAAPTLAKSSSATAVFGAYLIKDSQFDSVARALRVLELSPEPSVTQPATDVMLDSVAAATHIVMSLPHSVVPHHQLQAASSATSDSSSHDVKYKVQPQSSPRVDFAQLSSSEAEARHGDGATEEWSAGQSCCWDAVAVIVETSTK
jgi:hypothetical protein